MTLTVKSLPPGSFARCQGDGITRCRKQAKWIVTIDGKRRLYYCGPCMGRVRESDALPLPGAGVDAPT